MQKILQEFRATHERKEECLAKWKYRVKIKKIENLHHEKIIEQFIKVELELLEQKRGLMRSKDAAKETRILEMKDDKAKKKFKHYHKTLELAQEAKD